MGTNEQLQPLMCARVARQVDEECELNLKILII